MNWSTILRIGQQSEQWELSGDPDEVDFEVDKNAKALAEEFREWIMPHDDIEYMALEDQAWTDETHLDTK